MKFVVLSFFLLGAEAAVAHPGHGAIEIHWHLGDLVWAALGAVVLVGAGYLVRKWLRR